LFSSSAASTGASPPRPKPPEWAPLRLGNFVEIFTRYHFAGYFFNSMMAAVGSTVISLPLATAMAYAFARHNTGGTSLRLFILASQMLPPVILVLPMYSLPTIEGQRCRKRANRGVVSSVA
jgi:ABC-type glycerol-3-phosphate transport system permease component